MFQFWNIEHKLIPTWMEERGDLIFHRPLLPRGLSPFILAGKDHVRAMRPFAGKAFVPV